MTGDFLDDPQARNVTTGHVRRRDRDATREALLSAMRRVQERGEKLSISAVAAEVGVTPGLVHNTYPDIAEGIRAHAGRAVRQRLGAKASELAESKVRLNELRRELNFARADIAKLASLNETLRGEIAVLRAAVEGKVVALSSKK